MATLKREKMVDDDAVGNVDEIEIKSQEGRRFEREEEDRGGGERTGFSYEQRVVRAGE